MKFFSLASINQTILTITKRFPFVIIAILFAVISFIISIENGEDVNGLFVSLGFTSCLAVLSFLNTKIYYESYQQSRKRHYFVNGLVLLLLSIYFYYQYESDLKELKLIIRFWGVLMSLLLLASYIPYIRKAPYANFTNYNMILITRLLESFLFVLILFGTMSLAIVSIEQLFDLSFLSGKHYFQLLILLIGIVQGTYFLSNYPLEFQTEEPINYSKSFGVLCHYILIPILVIYLLISYAYMIKLIIIGEWVQDWFITMILWYFVIGIISYLFNYGYQIQVKNKWSERLMKYFFPVSLPLAMMLSISVYRKIEINGITEEHYMLAVLVLWIIGICLYYIISKKDIVRIIPISLSIIILLSVIGPTNMFQISIANQWLRLENNLIKIGVLTDGVLKPMDSEVDGQLLFRISNSLQYLQKNDQLKTIRKWDINQILSNIENEDLTDIKIRHHLKIESHSETTSKEEYIDYSGTDNYFMAIDSFNYLIPVVNFKNQIKDYKSCLLLKREQQVFIFYYEQDKFEFEVPDIGIFGYNRPIDEEKAHFWLKNENFEILVKVIHLSGIKRNGRYNLESIQANAFVKLLP